MIDSLYKNFISIPTDDGNITKFFDANKHLGLDFGYWVKERSNILSVLDGKVVDKFNDKTLGFGLVIQHDFSDNTHTWSSYIHLAQASNFNIGDNVKMNQVIGIKGNTGYSNGTHLHMYYTSPTTKAYSWNNMRSLAIDYYGMLCRSKNYNYVYLGNQLNWKPFIEEERAKVYPQPVERNESVKQVEVLIDYLNIRTAPGTQNEAYYTPCQMGIFNILEEKLDGEKKYNWYRIGTINEHDFWIASGGTRTKDLLPEEPEEEITQLKEEIKKLTQEIEYLHQELDACHTTITLQQDKMDSAIKVLE